MIHRDGILALACGDKIRYDPGCFEKGTSVRYWRTNVQLETWNVHTVDVLPGSQLLDVG